MLCKCILHWNRIMKLIKRSDKYTTFFNWFKRSATHTIPVCVSSRGWNNASKYWDEGLPISCNLVFQKCRRPRMVVQFTYNNSIQITLLKRFPIAIFQFVFSWVFFCLTKFMPQFLQLNEKSHWICLTDRSSALSENEKEMRTRLHLEMQ